jgi:hypothetical protein
MVRKGGDFCALIALVGIIGLAGWGGTSAFAQNFSPAISGVVRDGTAPSASAGAITETSNRERQIQFALKLLF